MCGDQVVDADGGNDIPGDGDDEVCDPGSFCPNGVPCNHNSALCPGQCLPAWTPTCTAECAAPYCGDGYVDLDGLDNDVDTLDDNEECDD